MNSINNILQIHNLSKTYHSKEGEISALQNVSFNVDKSEFVGIIGPSGCGKSTILNILSNYDKNYGGDIVYSKNLTIGYMIQEDALFPWLTVFNNAILGLKISKQLNEETISYVNNLLKKYNLYEFKDNYPHSLSGGMKQRLAIIRTLAINPDILLLDEAFSALDYQTRLKVSDDVYNIIKEENKTVIMVTHDIAEAISMCDKIIVLSRRPSTIKSIHKIELSDKKGPIHNRTAKEFRTYYDKIWKEIDS